MNSQKENEMAYQQSDCLDKETGADSNNAASKEIQIPPYLSYPSDGIAEMMFEDQMEEIKSTGCGYSFFLYKEAADTIPVIEKLRPPFEINEIHYYFRKGGMAWYSITTMKDESVRQNSVRNWVERADQFAILMGTMDQALRVPFPLRGRKYRKVSMLDMGQSALYDRVHGFDESNVYGHVFYWGEQLYKKFILVARKDNTSWRVEVNIPSDIEQIIAPDFVPAGQTFGKFFPLF